MKTTTCILIALLSTAFALPFEVSRHFSADDDRDETALHTNSDIPAAEPRAGEGEEKSKENESDDKDPMDVAASDIMKCCSEMGAHEHVHDHRVDNEKKDDNMAHDGDNMQVDQSQDSYQTVHMDKATTPQSMDSKEVKTRDADFSRDLKPPAVDASTWEDSYNNGDEKNAPTTDKPVHYD